ncbi:MAG TPA: tripartite tricarboxylate transporter substrate binding protein [Xanthobacteraceae bacterium]|jgi:tripartite-type tricarboxylate transporter receptor subunit TctC|nr:tripartite tricarboxylate transporter substrate binding protein [Xanthobacteraceae bacterium]
MRHSMMIAATAAAFAIGLASPAAAQKYPDRPVKIVLPFGAGGVADVTARIVAEKLGDKFGQRFVIENSPGAGGITAANAVLKAEPDGYTLGLVTNGTAISVALFKSLPFDPVKDFEMVSTIGTFDLVFAVNSDSPYKTLGDFIKAAKEQPGKLNVGTINVGGTQHLGAELFKTMAGVNVQIVPFKSSPEIVVALLRNDVQMLVEFPAAIKGQVADGKIRQLAQSGLKRSPTDPNVPTVDESGVKGYEVSSWNGVFAPRGTPKDVIATMTKAINEVVAMPEVKQKFSAVGIEAKSSTPDELMTMFKADAKKWDDVIVKAGIEKR